MLCPGGHFCLQCGIWLNDVQTSCGIERSKGGLGHLEASYSMESPWGALALLALLRRRLRPSFPHVCGQVAHNLVKISKALIQMIHVAGALHAAAVVWHPAG